MLFSDHIGLVRRRTRRRPPWKGPRPQPACLDGEAADPAARSFAAFHLLHHPHEADEVVFRTASPPHLARRLVRHPDKLDGVEIQHLQSGQDSENNTSPANKSVCRAGSFVLGDRQEKVAPTLRGGSGSCHGVTRLFWVNQVLPFALRHLVVTACCRCRSERRQVVGGDHHGLRVTATG